MHTITFSLRCYLLDAYEQNVGQLQMLVENIARNYRALQIQYAVLPIHFLNAAMPA
jgi:hypothetical protein